MTTREQSRVVYIKCQGGEQEYPILTIMSLRTRSWTEGAPWSAWRATALISSTGRGHWLAWSGSLLGGRSASLTKDSYRSKDIRWGRSLYTIQRWYCHGRLSIDIALICWTAPRHPHAEFPFVLWRLEWNSRVADKFAKYYVFTSDRFVSGLLTGFSNEGTNWRWEDANPYEPFGKGPCLIRYNKCLLATSTFKKCVWMRQGLIANDNVYT